MLLTSLTVQAQSDPAAAQNLRAELLAGGGVALSWDAPAEDAESITGYEILRRRPDRGENTLLSYVGDTRSNATSYTDLDAREPGEQSVYRVVALRGASRSGRSNFARVVVPERVPADQEPCQPGPRRPEPLESGGPRHCPRGRPELGRTACRAPVRLSVAKRASCSSLGSGPPGRSPAASAASM